MLSLAPLIARLTGFTSGKNDRYIILALLAIVAAGLWAWGNHQHTKFVTACQIAGSDQLHCLDAIRDLHNFKTDSATATAQALADNAQKQSQLSDADMKAAQASTLRQKAAITELEKQNAALKNDQISADWIGAINNVIELR
ncbi:hypothetical protein [Zymomonas mobilis]|uniref:hypothetical protein n=1 Tax=Zymomonas mobilis TaxID=542 RepID=UPI0021C44366|nr:hypothetical protein [Zymomonas mobilis]MCP9308702.1 hypothetical protein [Zymomonas mobilis]